MASFLRTVATGGSSPNGNSSNPTNDLGKRLVKWGLIIGVPTAVCVAAYLVYRHQQEQEKKSVTRRSAPLPNSSGDTTTVDDRPKDRLTLAIDLKNEGNIKYREQKFQEAIQAYTKAIETCPSESKEELSQFYQNRAATWESLKNFEKVIEDCSKAIELNPKYLKCVLRRARAAEIVENFDLALEDYSAACFIDSYQPSYVMAADKVLTQLAKKYIDTLPQSTAELSRDYVRTTLNEFEDDPILKQSFIDEIRAAQPESPLTRAYQAFDEGHFTDIPSLCTQELQSPTKSQYETETLLLRGSFYLLMGSYNEAIMDFSDIIDKSNVPEKIKMNAELKRANAKIHQRDLEGAMNEYEQCIKNHPNQCAPRVHRGMLKTLIESFSEARDDFDQALQISPTNLRAKYQKLINDAKIASKANRPERVDKTLTSFEEYFDTCKKDIYYALALISCYLDNDRKDKALEYLNKFVEEIPKNPTLMALKANCLMSADPSNTAEVEQLYNQALEIDPSNETVLTMFAMFKCNHNKFDEAANLYERAIQCSRGEEKLLQYAALLYAIRAQGQAMKRLSLNFPGGFPPPGQLPNWMGGMA